MKIRKLFQKLLYRICEAAFYFFYALLKPLSPSVFSKVAYPFLWLFVSSVVPKKRVVKNLSAAFGESYSQATKKGLARGVQEQFIQNLLDCFEQISDHEHARRTITIAGMEYLQSALQKGKGVIALGAHIFFWELEWDWRDIDFILYSGSLTTAGSKKPLPDTCPIIISRSSRPYRGALR